MIPVFWNVTLHHSPEGQSPWCKFISAPSFRHFNSAYTHALTLVSCLTFCKSKVCSRSVSYSSCCLSAYLILFRGVANDWCENDWRCVLQCSVKLCHFKSAVFQAQTTCFWNNKACMWCSHIAILLTKSEKKLLNWKYQVAFLDEWVTWKGT
jgi:hypothetical protein